MSKYDLGVIGGMGPMATSMFYERIIERTQANCDQEHLNLIIFNHATMPDRTKAILSGEHQLFLEQIASDLHAMESLGVKHIAIPCNTSHYFMKQMKAMTHLNIIDMVEETVCAIKEKFGTGARVGILATHGTIFTGTYEKACIANNLIYVKPNPKMQDQVMKVIYDIKAGSFANVHDFESIVMSMVEDGNCDAVILACTELSIIQLGEIASTYCVDAMDVLVEKSIEYSGKQYKR
ncbi:amino acid racemase [Fusibacter bizertensis]|jgi:aspartate racemase|uniref:Amino acid racemase n=1 Tax=Fusibacter bizertensis TaxID=1488331 RepID=A0ABT6NBD6_9FIRM|nr:amino acid racemase [Fusibacter bizertensis]MDH8677735.1 amino acid racemase [Fusibacter bizertensis]